jgi:hypothetical protein
MPPTVTGRRTEAQLPGGSSIATLGWVLGLLVSDRLMPPKTHLVEKGSHVWNEQLIP